MKKLLILIFLTSLISFSAHAGSEGQEELSKNSSSEVKDCFEGINRGIFAFNQVLDASLFEPLAKGYRLLPSPIRSGTSNFLSNLSLVVTVPNNVLQGDIGLAGKNTARFAVNSTIGILGLFDPATKLGLNDYNKEDYGQTLGRWGVGEGCYIVLPVLGPSTARDTIGSLANYLGGDAWYNITVGQDTHYVSDFDYYASKGADGIDFRAKNLEAINNLEKNSIDFYASVKSLYLQDRRKRILNSDAIIETQDDSDWEEIETQ
jgi:phospholipid-binding lipoprotein MlaA